MVKYHHSYSYMIPIFSTLGINKNKGAECSIEANERLQSQVRRIYYLYWNLVRALVTSQLEVSLDSGAQPYTKLDWALLFTQWKIVRKCDLIFEPYRRYCAMQVQHLFMSTQQSYRCDGQTDRWLFMFIYYIIYIHIYTYHKFTPQIKEKCHCIFLIMHCEMLTRYQRN